MNKQELNTAINNCITANSGIEIFIGLKNGELRKANFLAQTQQEIKDLFIQELKVKVVNSESSVINFSTADERGNAIYQYDLNETDDMQVFDTVLNAEVKVNIPYFSFDNDGIANMLYFIIVIGSAEHQLALYKQIAQINIYKRNSGFFVRRSNNEFAKVEDDFLRIIPGVDLFKVNGSIFVVNLKILEKSFNINDVIVASANNQIELIRTAGLIENIESLSNELSDISFARKLSKIAENSPVLGHVNNQQIISFTQNHPALRNVIKYSNDGSKIKLTSKKSKKLFLKLLNDDYLNSDLTNIYYDSLAKDTIPDNNDEE